MKPLEGHINRHFDGALGALHLHVVAMGSLALDQVRSVVRAYANWDRDIAATVLERERAINAYDDAIDEEQVALLARRSPVASDLRYVIAFSKAVGELERVGDEAKKLARMIREDEAPDDETMHDVSTLGQVAAEQLQRALLAFDQLDAEPAPAIISADRELDRRFDAALERLLARASSAPGDVRHAVRCAFALKALERIGDHAKNLARLLLH